MGRPKKEKISIAEKRRNELKIMYGSVEHQKPSYDPSFIDRINNPTVIVDPNEQMDKVETENFIKNFVPYSGPRFDDENVANRFFGKGSSTVAGLVDGRRLIYLMCIDRVSGITIEEFIYGVLGPNRRNQIALTEGMDIILELMYSGIIKKSVALFRRPACRSSASW